MEIDEKQNKKHLSESYRHRLLDKLLNLRQDSMSIQDYMNIFDDLTLRCEVKEDRLQTIYGFRSGLI